MISSRIQLRASLIFGTLHWFFSFSLYECSSLLNYSKITLTNQLQNGLYKLTNNKFDLSNALILPETRVHVIFPKTPTCPTVDFNCSISFSRLLIYSFFLCLLSLANVLFLSLLFGSIGFAALSYKYLQISYLFFTHSLQPRLALDFFLGFLCVGVYFPWPSSFLRA